MNIAHLYHLLIGKTNAKHPAKLTFANIKGFLQSIYRKSQRLINISGFEFAQFKWEQVIWRRTRVKDLSPKCWKENICKICGCDVIDKTLEDRGCEGFCYTEMMQTEEEWKEYKTKNKIKLFI